MYRSVNLTPLNIHPNYDDYIVLNILLSKRSSKIIREI